MSYKPTLEDELKEINEIFEPFFEKFNFRLKKSNIQEVVYENNYSELVFNFESYGTRFGYLSPPEVFYKKNDDPAFYSIKSLMSKLLNVAFDEKFKQYFEIERLGYYESYKRIINEFVAVYMKDEGFSWVKDFERQS